MFDNPFFAPERIEYYFNVLYTELEDCITTTPCANPQEIVDMIEIMIAALTELKHRAAERV